MRHSQHEFLHDIFSRASAILPFDNSNPDLNNVSFAEGVYEEVLNHLVKLKSLNVIAPASLQQYKNDTRPITEIGEELKVETIMDGSVRFADGRVAVSARLIDARTGVHLWSERYNREYTDIFGIQNDIATNIASTLKTELNPELNPIYGLASRVKGLTYLNEGRVEEARLSIDRAVNAGLR